MRICLVIAALALQSCDEPKVADDRDGDRILPNEDVMGGDRFILSEGKFVDNVVQANGGNGGASFDLFMHFAMGGSGYGPTPGTEEGWLSLAVTQGNISAMQHTLVRLVNQYDEAGCDKARDFVTRHDLATNIAAGEMGLAESDVERCALN